MTLTLLTLLLDAGIDTGTSIGALATLISGGGWVKMLIDKAVMKEKIATLTKKVQANEETMFKKFTGIHTREEKQRDVNHKLELSLARIEEKLDQALKRD